MNQGVGSSLCNVHQRMRSPKAISNLAAWFSADRGVTGSAQISSWADLSGGGFDVAGTGVGRPAIVAADLNGRAVVQFNGSSHFLSRANTTLGITSAGYCIAMVVKETTAAASGFQFALNDVGGTGGVAIWQITPNRALRHISLGDLTGSAVQTSTYEYRVYNFAAGSAPTLRVNAVPQTLTGSPTTLVAPPASSILCLGARNTGVDFWAACKIAEVCVWRRPLSTLEILRVEKYLKLGYNL